MFDTSRTEYMLGKEATLRLKSSHIAVFGLGGVGGGVLEALVRAGVGELTLIDGDEVAPSNLNRQLISLNCNIGIKKTKAAADRVHMINPDCKVNLFDVFYLPNTEEAKMIDFGKFDYIAECIDTVSAKLDIVCRADAAGIPIISAMGAGNKLHPELFELADIFATSVCPLARVMRKELKARGIKKLNTVYSREKARSYAVMPERDVESGKTPPGSISFVPPVMGYIMAGKIIRDIAEEKTYGLSL